MYKNISPITGTFATSSSTPSIVATSYVSTIHPRSESTRSPTIQPTVYTKIYHLMAYDYARACMYWAGTHNNLIYICISICVPRPIRERMNFSCFWRLVSWSTFSGSVSRYCYTLPLWYRHQGCLNFRSGMSVTDLPQIQSSIQPEKIQKWMSELNITKKVLKMKSL